MYLYENLRKLRTERKISQEEIGEILKITKQQYYLYENGKREIPIHHLITLADYYKVSIDYIVGRTENKEINK